MLGLSPSGQKFYSLTADGVVRLWDATSGRQLMATVPDYLDIMTVAPDGQTAALVNALGGIDLLNLASGALTPTIAGNWRPKAMAYNSPSVLMLLAPGGDEGDHLVTLDLTQKSVIEDNAGGFYTASRAFTMNADGRLLAFWSIVNYQDVLGVFTLAPVQPLFALGKLNSAEYATAFSPDGQYLVRANGTQLEFWNIQTRRLDKTLTGKRASFGNLVFSADGQRLYSASGEAWDVAAGKWLFSFPSKAARVALSANGEVLAGVDGSLWEAATGHLLGKLTGSLGPASAFGFTPDGHWLVWQTREGVVELWGAQP